MKTETEIRAEIQKLEAIATDLRNRGSRPYPILGAVSALRWVIGEGVDSRIDGLTRRPGCEPVKRAF
jgi:hypothetical protein